MGGIKIQSQKDNLQRNVLVISSILGVVIFSIGLSMYTYEELTFSFWASEPVPSYPYRDEAPMVMIAGAVIAVAGVGISFILPSTTGREEIPSGRVCLGYGYPLPKNVRFCPRCGKTVGKIPE